MSREVPELRQRSDQSKYPRTRQESLQVLGLDIDLPCPGEEVVGNEEENDIWGDSESFFEGFHDDTESCDVTWSTISVSHGQLVGDADVRLTKEDQFSRLSYFNRSQQSGLQGFTTPFPARVSERPSDPRDQSFGDGFQTMAYHNIDGEEQEEKGCRATLPWPALPVPPSPRGRGPIFPEPEPQINTYLC